MKTLGIKLGLVFSFFVVLGIGQTIFTESIGTVGGTTSIADHEAANGFDNDPFTMSGTGDVRATSASTGYVGASSGANVFLTSGGSRFFEISGVSTLGCSSLQLSFGALKSTTTSNMSELIVEFSTDGVTYIPIAIPLQPTGSGTANWRLITVSIPLAAENQSNVRLRWTNSAPATLQFRLDDISLEGVCGVLNTITIDAISSLIYTVDCDNDDTGSVDFSATGTYSIGNEFQAELSNASGSFSNPLVIGVLNGAAAEGTDPSGTIPIIIPAGTQSGTGFRIRIVSTLPSIISLDNGTDIEIQGEICPTLLPGSQGLLINEFSNGAAGTQEYYEFIVAGRCGETVDVRGYIIDDNNGTFTDYGVTGPTAAGSGIAQGHLRLTSHPQWSSIPVGSLIVVYNASDPNASLPADDPFDTDNDSLYVIPHTETSLVEISTNLPVSGVGHDSTYVPSTYGSLSWSPMGIANSEDAIQVRMPDGTYFHGVSYGGSQITGGPNNMKILNSGMGGMCGWFNSGDYLNASNWSTGTVAGNETPGLPNNAANYAWLRLMRDPTTTVCPVVALPISLLDFTAKYNGINTELNWQTASEQDNDYFTLSHSLDGKNFTRIATIPGSGNTDFTINYAYTHLNTPAGINYYKLRSVDFDGTIHEKGIVAVVVEMEYVFYNQLTGQIFFPNTEKSYAVYDLTGRQVLKSQFQSSVAFSNKGIYLVVDEWTGKSTKIIVN